MCCKMTSLGPGFKMFRSQSLMGDGRFELATFVEK